MVMPGSPAPPQNSAHIDQPNAASTPTEISVSIVAARCRALTAAARWNGHAAQTTTGPARANESHCQNRNCAPGTIASTTTGAVSSAEMISRWRRLSVSSGWPRSATSVLTPASACGGSGSRAV